MHRWELVFHNAAAGALGLSGVAYGVMKYFLAAADPDSRIGIPWEQPALKAHILAAPLFVFGLGLVISSHALKRFREGDSRGRMTGAALLWLAAPLIVSGYAVQVLTGDAARKWTGWLHAVLGAVFLLGYAAHLLKRRWAAGRESARTATRTRLVGILRPPVR